MSTAEIPDFVSFLPERVWYLTSTGKDMWCRRPYTFFFTTSHAAVAFAARIAADLDLSPMGIASKELVSEEGIAALRKLDVTRVFVDPTIDEATGDVFGKILRITPQN